jgi:hypothetical protein
VLPTGLERAIGVADSIFCVMQFRISFPPTTGSLSPGIAGRAR